MSASLVGSEMCIRDSRGGSQAFRRAPGGWRGVPRRSRGGCKGVPKMSCVCLLYTSDAADDM
eukprot:14610790-Alexandrium_andersonii.AAC.1